MRYLSQATLKAVKDYVESQFKSTGKYPTIREIAGEVGISVGSAHRYIQELDSTGAMRYTPGKRMETNVTRKVHTEGICTAIVGTIACGTPTLAEENIEGYVNLPAKIFGHGDFFILHASGLSMIEAGIDEGDLVVVRKQSFAKPGDVVVALVDTETTLKTYYPEPKKKRIRLHPENSTMRDIYVRDGEIQGVAVDIIKPVLNRNGT